MEYQELIPIWDGSALVVATEPMAARTVFRHTHIAFALKTAVVVMLVLAFRVCRRRLTPWHAQGRGLHRLVRSGAGAVSFALAALLVGLLYHSCMGEALLTAPRALALVRHAHQGDFIPRVGIHRVQRLLGNDAVFVDARFARDYARGHLDGAINVPVDTNDVRRQTIMADVGKNTKVVVYCQSAQCKFAEFLSLALRRDGYSDVSIFRGGWREWSEKE